MKHRVNAREVRICERGRDFLGLPDNLYSTHENPIPSFHRKVIAAILASPSLILYNSS